METLKLAALEGSQAQAELALHTCAEADAVQEAMRHAFSLSQRFALLQLCLSLIERQGTEASLRHCVVLWRSQIGQSAPLTGRSGIQAMIYCLKLCQSHAQYTLQGSVVSQWARNTQEAQFRATIGRVQATAEAQLRELRQQSDRTQQEDREQARVKLVAARRQGLVRQTELCHSWGVWLLRGFWLRRETHQKEVAVRSWRQAREAHKWVWVAQLAGEMRQYGDSLVCDQSTESVVAPQEMALGFLAAQLLTWGRQAEEARLRQCIHAWMAGRQARLGERV